MRKPPSAFFEKALGATDTVTPRVITGDKNAAYPQTFKQLQAAKILAVSCELRQSNYLNNLVEQDHRFLKRLTKPGMGFFSFEAAWRTLQGFEVMNMMRKGQMQGVSKGDSLRQAAVVAELFGIALSIQQKNSDVLPFVILFGFCNTASDSANDGQRKPF